MALAPYDCLVECVRRGYIVSGGGVAPFASEIVAEVIKSGQQQAHLDHLREVYRYVLDTPIFGIN